METNKQTTNEFIYFVYKRKEERKFGREGNSSGDHREIVRLRKQQNRGLSKIKKQVF